MKPYVNDTLSLGGEYYASFFADAHLFYLHIVEYGEMNDETRKFDTLSELNLEGDYKNVILDILYNTSKNTTLERFKTTLLDWLGIYIPRIVELAEGDL